MERERKKKKKKEKGYGKKNNKEVGRSYCYCMATKGKVSQWENLNNSYR